MDASGNRYARTKRGTYAFKRLISDIWSDISNDEWSRQQMERNLVRSVDIPTLIPNKITEKFQWNLRTNRSVTSKIIYILTPAPPPPHLYPPSTGLTTSSVVTENSGRPSALQPFLKIFLSFTSVAPGFGN